MKQFLTFVKKEFAHVLRDKKTLLILFGLPVVQILIFGFALTNEVKNAKIIVQDNAKDPASQQLINKIEASQYFELEKAVMTPAQVEQAFKEGVIKLAVIIPANSNEDLIHQNKAPIQVIADATDPNTATTLTNYVQAIVQDYQSDLNKT